EILLDAQLWHIERVANILGVHQQVDFLVHRDRHFRRHDIVFCVLIVRRVDTEEISISFVDLIGMNGAKLAIRAGIAKIESKLSRLHLNRYGIGGWRSEVYAGPRLHAEHTQSQALSTYQQKGRDHQS